MSNREPYEKPEVQEQSVEEMLSEAQVALDGLSDKLRRAQDSLEDLEAVVSSLADDADKLSTELANAERLVQKVTYVAKVKGEQDEGPTET